MTAGVDGQPRPAPKGRAVRAPLYRPLSWAVLRAPLLPVSDYLRVAGAGPDDHRAMLRDDVVRTALAVGSPDLLDALQRGPDARDRDRQYSSLLRYLVRMSSRPTPFGMFAGVALVRLDEATTITLDDRPRTHSRPDMEWLADFLADAASDPEIRHAMRVVANRAVVVRGGRVFLVDEPGAAATSVRATPAVVRALELAARPVPFTELAGALLERPGATREKVVALLDEMVSRSLLHTELRPSLLSLNPAQRALQQLEGVPPAQGRAGALRELMDDLAAFDAGPEQGADARYARARQRAGGIHARVTTPIQVDMTWPVNGSLAVRVAQTAARAAEIMLSMSPAPFGPPALEGYKRSFESRYGHDRLVPLLELLDPGSGLGPVAAAHAGYRALPPDRAARRSRRLLDLAIDALRDGRPVVDLTEEDLAELRTCDVLEGGLPTSLELSLFVLAETAHDVDAGRYQVVVGPNLGAQAAGRNLGRFAAALGPLAVAALHEAADRETELHPDRIWAEVVYLPRHARSGNVAVRPTPRRYAVVSAVDADEGDRTSIPLDELAVGLDQDRLRVVWSRDGREVVPCAGHMLNTRGATPAAILLDEIARDGRTEISPFDWGQAASMPALPRVSHGQIVLRPAQWTLDRPALRAPTDSRTVKGFGELFARWCERWSVPRYVYVAAGDNRLLLDLRQPLHVEEIHRELVRSGARGALVLQEALPGPEHAWLQGPSGRYLSEIVVPLVRDAAAGGVPASARAPTIAVRAGAPAGMAQRPADRTVPPTAPTGSAISTDEALRSVTVSTGTRIRLPGSDWLYAKLYVPTDVEEDVLLGPLHDFVELCGLAELTDGWFFLRYADPEPHLRLRFHGDPGQLTDALLPRLFRWAAQLHDADMCTSLVVDTYEREVERYGGELGIDVAEAVFCSDSPAILQLLAAADGRAADLDRLTLAVLSVDDLLESLGYDRQGRARWYEARVRDRRASGEAYRQRGNTLRELLADPASLGLRPGGDRVRAALAARGRTMGSLGQELAALEARGGLTVDRDDVVASVVHLHFNRLLGRGVDERVPLGLALRTWRGLGVATR